MLNSVSVVS